LSSLNHNYNTDEKIKRSEGVFYLNLSANRKRRLRGGFYFVIFLEAAGRVGFGRADDFERRVPAALLSL
jgi:hypothetical protein